jgi:hypothetical protein
VQSVPEELQAEPVNRTQSQLPLISACNKIWLPVLIIRVLYRLRSLSEQTPFDAATLSYAFPLLSQVIIQGGVSPGAEDDPLEQVALALDIIRFHCGECVSGECDILLAS